MATSKGVDVTVEAARLRNWAEANDARYVDWDAMFRNWLDKARPGTAPAVQAAPKRLTADDLRKLREEGLA